MKTIAIYHHKGGVGKTTVAVNLAAVLRKRGKRILLVDIDAQANSTFATGLIKFEFEQEDDLKTCNVYHLLENTHLIFVENVVKPSNCFNQPEIDVVPSHITLISQQPNLTRFASTAIRLARKLDKVTEQYDFVIIDTPPSLDLYAQASLTAADYLIIPSDLKPFSNQGLSSVGEFVNTIINENREGLGKEPLNILGVLPSKISPNPMYLKHTFPKHQLAITEVYNFPLMETVILERTALSKCINQTILMGDLEIPAPQSILDYALKAPQEAKASALEFEQLADEVLSKIEV
ncbi:AAA family ATPase [Spirulina subsalsa FACHB-351]|uniref:AAA family ATPase n=1 Tax=Spirulina subsalsa FACHB-351 TaxID=234711 RepID=A0ABT3LBS5_9CYAN|nr:AAA family ATPase [Spirulina subsalsa]MCW6038963.1 AAA family ATPase [Spirulina subsalsa FACHB-351]